MALNDTEVIESILMQYACKAWLSMERRCRLSKQLPGCTQTLLSTTRPAIKHSRRRDAQHTVIFSENQTWVLASANVGRTIRSPSLLMITRCPGRLYIRMSLPRCTTASCRHTPLSSWESSSDVKHDIVSCSCQNLCPRSAGFCQEMQCCTGP